MLGLTSLLAVTHTQIGNCNFCEMRHALRKTTTLTSASQHSRPTCDKSILTLGRPAIFAQLIVHRYLTPRFPAPWRAANYRNPKVRTTIINSSYASAAGSLLPIRHRTTTRPLRFWAAAGMAIGLTSIGK